MHRRLRLALHRLRLPAVAAVAAGMLALPAGALAGNLTVDHNAHTATYKAAAGEANNVSFYRQTKTYRIQDPGVQSIGLTEIGREQCDQDEEWRYFCPIVSVSSASVSLGDGADTFDGANSTIAFTITAGPGVKKIATGAGADTINAHNGNADQIACGDGADTVMADANDAVDPSCEAVDLSGSRDTATGGGDPTTGTDDPQGGRNGDGPQDVFHTPLGLTVALTTVPVANYNARLKLQCAADANQGCRGDIVLELPAAKSKPAQRNRAVAARGQYVARQRRRNRRLGKRSYRIDPGEKATIAVPMRARGHYRYVSRRRRSRAILRITERDPAGKVIDVQTRSITLASKQGQR